MSIRYMHTLDGCPATYVKNSQVCFAGGRGKSQLIHLTRSLKKLKAEQIKSEKWREKQGFVTRETILGFVRIIT